MTKNQILNHYRLFVCFCVRYVRFYVRFVRFVRVRLTFYRETDKTDSDTPHYWILEW